MKGVAPGFHTVVAWDSTKPKGFMLTRITVVSRGVMFAGICWEVQGEESRVTECLIIWFAMFSCYDRVINLMEGGR
jgi:hypothetical protein